MQSIYSILAGEVRFELPASCSRSISQVYIRDYLKSLINNLNLYSLCIYLTSYPMSWMPWMSWITMISETNWHSFFLTYVMWNWPENPPKIRKFLPTQPEISKFFEMGNIHVLSYRCLKSNFPDTESFLKKIQCQNYEFQVSIPQLIMLRLSHWHERAFYIYK